MAFTPEQLADLDRLAQRVAEADLANAERAKAEALAGLQRSRCARRDNQPLPQGSLFDDVTRRQGRLF